MQSSHLPETLSLAENNEHLHLKNRSLVFTRSTSFWVSDLGWSPNTDIFETEDSLVIRIEIAGVDKGQIDVRLKGDTLTICGFRHDTRRAQQVHFHQAEINYGPFEKVIILPESLQDRKIDAKYLEGFLEIVIAKMPTHEANAINTIKIDE